MSDAPISAAAEPVALEDRDTGRVFIIAGPAKGWLLLPGDGWRLVSEVPVDKFPHAQDVYDNFRFVSSARATDASNAALASVSVTYPILPNAA